MGWREDVQRLQGLPLLPLKGKAPINPVSGYGWRGWEEQAVSPVEVLATPGVTGCGLRVGPACGLICFDLDGASGIAAAIAAGCDPAEVRTWVVARTGTSDRIKVLFKVSAEQSAQLTVLKCAITTFHDQANRKREGIEVFHGVGQVVVCGDHPDGDSYCWPAGCGPDAVAPLPAAWLTLALHVRDEAPNESRATHRGGSTTTRTKGSGGEWRKVSPCPICGRDQHLACTQTRDGQVVVCVDGDTFGFTLKHGPLRPGAVVHGIDGQQWAFIRSTYSGLWAKDLGVFCIDRPKPTTRTRKPSMQQQPVNPLAPQAAQLPPPPDGPALEAFRRDIKERIDDGGSDLQILITEKTLQYDITSYQAEAIVRELRKEQDADAATTASVQQILEERKSLDYRRTELKLEPLLPKCLLASMRFVMTALPGCDELAAGMIYLGAVSGVLKTGTLIRANYRSFVVPPNMYLAIVGKSGLGKSPTITNIGVRSLDLVRNNYRNINRERYEAWEIVNNPLPRKDRAPKPKPVMMALENYTGEYLAELLQVHEEYQLGLLISCDELSAVFKSLNSYKPGGKGTDEQQLLSLFDGRGSAQGRVDAGVREFDYAQFSILGGMQPRVFDMLAQGGDPFGLYARMHLLPMDDTDQYQDPVETPETIIQYEQHVRQLQNIALRASLLPPAHYRLSDEAMRELAKVQHQARELARAAELDEQSSVYGKRAGQIARLAGIVHILRVAAEEIAHDEYISLQTVSDARDVVTHIQQYALAAHARIQAVGQDDDWLVKSIVKSCKGRQLTAAQYRSQYLTRNKKPLYSTAAIQAAMQRLADAGVLTVASESSRSTAFTAA